MAITLGKREHRYEVEVTGQDKPLALVMRHMTAGERPDFRNGSRRFAAFGDDEKREALSEDERASLYIEFGEFASKWVARLVTRAENLVLDGEPVAWPVEEPERLDLLAVCGDALILDAYTFLSEHCSGIASVDQGN